MKTVYLDNAGSTMVCPEALEAAFKCCKDNYANPSAIHLAGVQASRELESCKYEIAQVINSEQNEIYFTSGGTESNNLAIFGAVNANKRNGNHIITTNIEHSSLRNTVLELERQGFKVTFLNVDEKGYVSLDELKNSITSETILVSIMHVNNEVGTIQNIEEIGKLIKKVNPNTLFHIDAIQSFAKYDINVKKDKIDLLSLSGHKIHSMKGTGAIYVRNGVKIKNIVFGGGQQNGLRSGTENVPGIVSLREATKYMREHHEEVTDYLRRTKEEFFNQITKNIPDVYLNGPSIEEGAYHILNIHIKGIKAPILINALSEKGIYVSAGSACNANSKNASGTLISIGLAKEDIEGSIRISFSRYTDIKDARYVAEVMKETVEEIRKVSGYTK
ncbi:MAG: cysteine desulfurase [Clostridia bacterium]|nr:cysteine desulfurase [Clostridia bacterium]